MRSSATCMLACLVALVVAILAPVAPVQAAGNENGPILTVEWPQALRSLDGKVVADLAIESLDQKARFSPTGDRLAYVQRTDTADYLLVRDNRGSLTKFGPYSGIGSVTWSPDGAELALLITDGFPSDPAASIARLRLEDGGLVPLVADSDTFDVEAYSDISWGPTGIVFVGGQPRPVVDPDEEIDPGDWNYHQLFTVAPNGGAPARFNEWLPQGCFVTDAVCSYGFKSPEWSPDGSRVVVAVDVESGSGVRRSYVATIPRGAVRPDLLTEVDYGVVSVSPSYSPDGRQILFQDGEGMSRYSVIYNAGTRTRLPAVFDALGDWQPCPSGVCSIWAGKQPSSISVNVATRGLKIRVNGQVVPNKSGQSVKLVLKRKVRGKWKQVATESPKLSAKSRYVLKFARPKSNDCMIVGSYPGDSAHLPSSRRVEFYC